MSQDEIKAAHPTLRPLDISVENGVLRSRQYDDIFFSNEDGLKESVYVFLEGTELSQKLLSSNHITIAETGFGTGLNLTAVMQLVDRLGVKTKIDYISFENCPLTDELIEIAHQKFQAIKPYSTELRKNLPPRWPGAHFRHLSNGQINLHLHYGTAENLMPKLDFQADIWFLDGFSPAKNTDLWSSDLCKEIARLSAPDARIATFTVAAHVRKGLEEAGFVLEKRPGFGRKRDMLTASLSQTSRPNNSIPQNIVVIGGGIAGASIAAGLYQAGFNHVLIDEAPELATAASGNPLGLQIPRLRVVDQPMSRLSLSAFSTAMDVVEDADALISKGVIALDMPEREAVRHRKLSAQGWPTDLLQYVSPDETSKMLGMELEMGAMFYPTAQVISPAKLTRHLAKNSMQILGHAIKKVQKIDEGSWHIYLSNGQKIEADHIILAAGAGLPKLLKIFDLPELPLQVTSGQLTYFPSDSSQAAPNFALNYGGYVALDADGKLVAGASFDRSGSMSLSDDAHNHNLGLMPPALANKLSKGSIDGRVSQRLATTDRWPLMGHYAHGISVISALSALGLTFAPLLGQIHAQKLAHRPFIVDREILSVLDPMRFAKRAAKRQ